jgi:polyferredoxin
VLYTVLIAAVSGLMLFGLINRTELELDAYRDRAPNYVICLTARAQRLHPDGGQQGQ